MAIPAKIETLPPSKTIEDVLISGDLSKLSSEQRTEYYLRVCKSLGLNPMTQPFEFITLNGKLRLYALRACADQLRKINGISIEIVSQDLKDGLLSVHVRAKDNTGRVDEDLGVVAHSNLLKGEAAANNILKAVTKAKRRVTLSISGLGYLDETEVADIPASAKAPAPKEVEKLAPKQIEPPSEPVEIQVPFDTENGKRVYNWVKYGQFLLAAVKASPDKRDKWVEFNNPHLDELAAAAKEDRQLDKVYRRLLKALGY